MKRIPVGRTKEVNKELNKFLEELIEQHQIKLAIPKNVETKWYVTQITFIADYVGKKWWVFGFLKAGSIMKEMNKIMKIKKL
ncbi:MAG: hypothetical protein ABID61_02680 [Candidatus Micrarchaeota archaeon]